MEQELSEKEDSLRMFVDWVKQHIKGDEKGEAHLFLEHLLKAFGNPGIREVGAELEFRVRKGSGRGVSFADMVWKPVVLIEMKKRGENLQRHYRQAFDYWVRIVPGRPRYVILCNFDELWIYDFETQMDVPVDKVSLTDLPTRYGPLAFLFPTREEPIFGDNHEDVTREQADRLASCFNHLIVRGIPREISQRFVLQLLVALFADDIGLLPRYTVNRILEDCSTPKDAYDLLGGLFKEMNTPGITPGGRFEGVSYFNGGLFASPIQIELDVVELSLLKNAANADWSKVRPEIFGTLFEHSLEKERRHAFGAHFTTATDIMKIVLPTIVQPWQEAIENAESIKRLNELLYRMQNYRVLDPACGSGNFLYIAYREIKRLEARIQERISEISKKAIPSQLNLTFVTAKNFFGIDINPFAVEIAKVTLMIARKLAIDELHSTEHPLPMDNLDSNFFAADALLVGNAMPMEWPKADVIIGNPPFLGAKRLKPSHGSSYVNTLRSIYPQIPGMADYCVYWYRKAHSALEACTAEDPFRGRAGLVGTQNVRNNKSRVGGLDFIAETGTIVDAVENEPWSGEANVNVSIVNWIKSQGSAIVPKEKKLWHAGPLPKGYPVKNKQKGYQLMLKVVTNISSSLSDEIDVKSAEVLDCNVKPQKAFQGITPGYDGFVLNRDDADEFFQEEGGSNAIIRPYLIGRELMSGDGKPQRFLIDADGYDVMSLARWPSILSHLKNNVLPAVQETLAKTRQARSDMEKAREEHLARWWTFWARRTELRNWMRQHPRIIAASRTQRWPFVFEFIPTDIIPGDKLQLWAFDDDYSFGIIQSVVHCDWFKAKGARLKNEVDFNYSSDSIFDTFPWPQEPSSTKISRVTQASIALRELRLTLMSSGSLSLRRLYELSQLPGNNQLKETIEELDMAVIEAYGWKKSDDLRSRVLALNREVYERIKTGQAVTAPGIPGN